MYYLLSRLVVVFCLLSCLHWDPASPTPLFCSEDQCRPPNCTCASNFNTNSDAKYRPQIVTISFDDAVTAYKYKAYRRLFNSKRRNPNGCPISATFFVSGNGGNRYDLVRQLYNDGHEIACHTATHQLSIPWWDEATKEQLTEEVIGMRGLLVQKAGIPFEEIRGMRMPYLTMRGDEQLEMIKEAGLRYDSSCMAGPSNTVANPPVWPFTWDHVIDSTYCDHSDLPWKTYPGIWELPLNRWIGHNGLACSMLDGCQSTRSTEGDAKNGRSSIVSQNASSEVLYHMWQNFHRHYEQDRTPLGMHLHATWFLGKGHRFEALDRFLDELLERKDVYIVTMYQLVQWMQNQVQLKDLNSFAAWQTSCKGPRNTTNTSALNFNAALTTSPTMKKNSHDDIQLHREKRDHPDDNEANSNSGNQLNFVHKEDNRYRQFKQPRGGRALPLLLTIFGALTIIFLFFKCFSRQIRLYWRQCLQCMLQYTWLGLSYLLCMWLPPSNAFSYDGNIIMSRNIFV